jgi:hypothetical protein
MYGDIPPSVAIPERGLAAMPMCGTCADSGPETDNPSRPLPSAQALRETFREFNHISYFAIQVSYKTDPYCS